MTFRFATLGSGSKGNCYFVEADGRRILLDAGLSARQIEMRLGVLGIDPASLDGIIISHEHIDHVAGLRVMVKRYGLPVWCNDVTRAALNEKLGTNIPVTIIQTGREFTIGGIRVHPFSVSHDAADPIGLTLQAGNVRLGLAEDLGYA
ncbi:MBL fold metallo-hydrolase, partial [bacterium]|nr:MBL fold metallo-hydrolase [candidate division CSSED10-310 bacterium]